MKEDFKKTEVDQPVGGGKIPSFGYSLAACLAFLIIVCLGLIVFKVDTVITALTGLVVVVLMSKKLGYKFIELEKTL